MSHFSKCGNATKIGLRFYDFFGRNQFFDITYFPATRCFMTRNNFFYSSHTKSLEIYDWETVFVLWSYETMVFI